MYVDNVTSIVFRDSNRQNNMIMKLLGSTESPQNENPVGYNFPRHPTEPDFQQFAPKQPTWPTGDDAIINVSLFFIFKKKFIFLLETF